MFKNKLIAVVIPCFNEEKQITKVLNTIPNFVDHIVVVNDASRDKTSKVINELKRKKRKIILIDHKKNQGPGGAIASGYKWARDNKVDVAAVMAGDGQMLPKDLPIILEPVAKGLADYSKANRLLSPNAYIKIPLVRLIGNSILTFLTKIASGYWHVMDSQAGFTAINKKMLRLIDWDATYKSYGQPNDLLVRLNVFNAKVKDVLTEPVYGVGEKSKIRIRKVFLPITFMILRMFFWRLKEKYIKRDFHPLVLFYFFGFSSGFISILLFARLLYFLYIYQNLPSINFLAWMLSVITSVQFTLFAMWFDMEYNKDLK